MKVYRAADVFPVALIREAVAVLGYGNLGRSVALNLRDSGVKVSIVQAASACLSNGNHGALHLCRAERANEACLVDVGAALRARNRGELRRCLDALLRGPEVRATLAAAARSLRRPEAGRTVAKEVLAVIGQR